MSKTIQTIKLQDMSGGNKSDLPVTVEVTEQGIFIGFQGYGDLYSSEGNGKPVLIELWNGVPRVVIWEDINTEDPQIIPLDKALETNRKEE